MSIDSCIKDIYRVYMTELQELRRKEWCRKYYKKWREKNPEIASEYARRWRLKNKESIRAYQRGYQKALPKNSSERLGRILRCRITSALSGRTRSGNLSDLIGCSLIEFIKHIEAQFVAGMTWDNHGTVWHIDHKKPCALFDLSKPDEQAACFHFTNQQPLPALENLKKSDMGARKP